MLENFLAGAAALMNPVILIDMFVGVFVGIVAGAIPGFTITMAIILTLPFTFTMEPIQGIATMMGVFVGGLSGGLITAALLGIPGTPSSVATTFDAFPMAKKGEPGKALGIGIWASFFGSILSAFILIFAAPQLAGFAVKMGPWEYFSLIVFALTIIASISETSLVKGIIAGLLGLAIATVGTDPISGVPRFTFGLYDLGAGLPFLTVLIGIFAISQLFSELEKKEELKAGGEIISGKFKFKPIESMWIVLKQPVNLIRSTIIGAVIGAIPGAGSSISNMLAYDQAKKASKYPEKFGTGIADGTVASEAGNNATAGGSLIPMIAFGIPGDAVTAVMIAALMVHGINPGPMFILEQPVLVNSIFAGFMIAAVMMLLIQFLGVRIFLKLTNIPKYILIPVVLAFCVLGSFALHNRLFDVYGLVALGLLGYIMKKLNFPLAPVILGVILGPIAERNLRRALMASPDWTLFFTRPISLVFLLIAAASIIYALWQHKKTKQRMAEASAEI
ncbi:MAG: tripartite tricarboxylate transporter permease [Firmicutes bacterium]|nr:tripartite tricarboxylate transporter permease [Bacillota bacterium]